MDFPTVYMLISNLTALVGGAIYTPNANHFFLLFVIGVFRRHLTVVGKMQMSVSLETLVREF